MIDDGPIRVAAAAAAVFGVFAAVTGHGAAALLAGVSAVACAALTTRSSGAGTAEPAAPVAPAIDLRDEPSPADQDPVQPVVQVPLVQTSADGSPQLLDVGAIDESLRRRIAVARRALRPLSVVHILILGTEEGSGPVPAELIAAAATATLRESDLVGRRDDGVYVVVLEDTGEDGAVWTTERLRRHIAGTIGPRRFQAGVASYPNHGLDAEAVAANAAKALQAAQEWDRDRIEVAVH